MSDLSVFKDVALPIILAGAGFLAAKAHTYFKRRKDFGEALDGDLSGAQIRLTVTLFKPREDERGAVDMEIRNSDIDLDDKLNPKLKQLIYYMQKAAKKCTDYNPCILNNLEAVTPPSEYEKILETLSSQMRNIISAELNRDGLLPYLLGDVPEKEIYAVLAHEEESEHNLIRVFLIPKTDVLSPKIPSADKVYVYDEDKDMDVRDPEHFQMQRLKTHATIIKALQETPSLRGRSRLKVPEHCLQTIVPVL